MARGAELAQLGLEREQAIGLLDAQVRDVAQLCRAAGEQRHDGDGERRVGHLVHVDAHAAQATRGSAHLGEVGAAQHLAAHRLEHAERLMSAWIELGRDALDAHAPAAIAAAQNG